MHEQLVTYINRQSPNLLTSTEIEMIREVFIPKKIRKRQYFLQEGDVCKYAAFIIKGAMREYYVDDKGSEHITRLLTENWWASDRESFVMLTPAVYNIDALEDCEVLLLRRPDYLNLLKSIPAVNEAMRKANDNLVIFMQKRVASISLSAEERFADFLKTNTGYLQRFPQHIIASYLGITKETLSRIRGNALKRIKGL